MSLIAALAASWFTNKQWQAIQVA